MAESRSAGTPEMPLPPMWRYTNAPTVFRGAGDHPFVHINMDSWYYAEWADPNHLASLGTVALGDAPLTAAQGVAAFVARQVALFLDAFAGVFRPVWVQVGFQPRLSGVVFHAFHFAGPQIPEDVAAIQTALEQSADAYEGLVSIRIAYEMRATVRNANRQLTEVWLPEAGEASYQAHYTDGYRSNLPRSVAVTHLLTPSAQAGIAQWTANLECTFISLLRESNADVLGRVRTRWQQWLQTHPIDAELADGNEDENDETVGDSEERTEEYIVTLAVPPSGTPSDNRDLAERNMPRVRAAVARWEQRLGTPLEWVVTL